MTTPLELTRSERPDGTPVLVATGEIDMSNAEAFHTALAEAIRADTPLVVDLTPVHYLDIAGLAALFTALSTWP
jgi:anti-sigma B factor antagonist